MIFTVLFVGGCLLLGMILAILLDQGLRGEAYFRSLFLFPMAISFIVTGVVWRWLMNPAAGSRMSGFNLLFDNMGLGFSDEPVAYDPQLGHCRDRHSGDVADDRLYNGALSGRSARSSGFAA